jgi:uncharacterized membrane protein
MASAPTPTPPASSGMQNNVAGALCYITIVGIIFLFIEPYNKNRFIRFHAFQSIFFAVGWVVVWIAFVILSVILGIISHGLSACITFPMWLICGLGLFIVWIILIVKAYGNQEWKLPIIGALAAKQAGN